MPWARAADRSSGQSPRLEPCFGRGATLFAGHADVVQVGVSQLRKLRAGTFSKQIALHEVAIWVAQLAPSSARLGGEIRGPITPKRQRVKMLNWDGTRRSVDQESLMGQLRHLELERWEKGMPCFLEAYGVHNLLLSVIVGKAE